MLLFVNLSDRDIFCFLLGHVVVWCCVQLDYIILRMCENYLNPSPSALQAMQFIIHFFTFATILAYVILSRLYI